MPKVRLHSLLARSLEDASPRARAVWLSLALLIAASYGAMALLPAFSNEYLVQDDARQHVVWMQRFVDPELFPNDLISDYYQSVAPYGYSTLYWLAAAAGVNPLVFNKLLPGLLGLGTTAYAYALAIRVFPAHVVDPEV